MIFSLEECTKSVVCSHLADIGNACKVNLILQTILGVSLVGLAEALALGKFGYLAYVIFQLL